MDKINNILTKINRYVYDLYRYGESSKTEIENLLNEYISYIFAINEIDTLNSKINLHFLKTEDNTSGYLEYYLSQKGCKFDIFLPWELQSINNIEDDSFAELINILGHEVQHIIQKLYCSNKEIYCQNHTNRIKNLLKNTVKNATTKNLKSSKLIVKRLKNHISNSEWIEYTETNADRASRFYEISLFNDLIEMNNDVDYVVFLLQQITNTNKIQKYREFIYRQTKKQEKVNSKILIKQFNIKKNDLIIP